ncbi:MAG: DUF427 domain-containing protein [Acidimicrobiia bacterium]
MLNPLNILKKPSIPTTQCAVVGETVVAESKETQRVEGNHYFPPESVNWDYLEPSDHTSVCPWKGFARYYDVVVDGKRLPAAAWTYETPSDAAQHIAGHLAFWHGVKVVRAL